jgi:lysophospholipase L1-like esterase
MEVPPLPRTWDRYDAQSSRLSDGLLLPEPDYVFCAMGTNDYRPEHMTTFVPEYLAWLAAVRKCCPNAQIFCITPPLGTHREDVVKVVDARRRQGDPKVHRIDTSALGDGFAVNRPTRLAYDGVHPSMYGNALLSGLIVAQVEEVLKAEQK